MNVRPTRTTRHRVVTWTAASALAVGGLMTGAGAASAAPEDPDVTGVAVGNGGAGLADVYVTAFTTPADGTQPKFVSRVAAGADGRYTFDDLDAESLALNETDPAIVSETDFKLYFEYLPSGQADAAVYHTTGYLNTGLGGSKTYRNAGSVKVTTGATTTAPTQALYPAGGVLLRVLAPSGAPVNSYGAGTLYEPDAYDPVDAARYGASTGSDDAFYPDTNGDGYGDGPDDGLVYISGVEPGKDYAVLGYGSDYNPTTDVSTNYVSRFAGGNGSYTTAASVAVAANAFTPVTIQLTNALTAVQSPKILGNASFGSTLRADPGTWSQQQGTEFTYQWLRGSTPVATGAKYKVTKADKNKRIRLVVTATSVDSDFVGSVATARTAKVGEKSKVLVKKLRDGKLAVTVKVAKKKLAKKLGTPTGKVVVLNEDGEKASKKVRLKNGRATLNPTRKATGKLTVAYLGGKRIGPDTAKVKGGKKK